MAVLRINGYAVAGRIGYNQNYTDIASRRDYSPNGLYQLGRNGVARSWKFSTRPLPRDEAIALAMMLSHHGDAWVWGLSSDPDGVVYVTDDTAPEVWSDARRLPQAAEASCSVVSAYGADGARVYDWNGNAYAPFDSCEGALLVEPGTTNIATANQYDPANTTGFATYGSGALSANAANYWVGDGSVEVPLGGGGGTEGVAVTGFTGLTDYVISAYVKIDTALLAGNVTLSAQLYDSTAATALGSPKTVTPVTADGWYRVYNTGSPAGGAGSTVVLRVYVGTNNTAGSFFVDGVQCESDVNDGYPTAPIDPGSDPWGSGNGVRDDGVLAIDPFMNTYTSGHTISAWVNMQYAAATTDRYLFRSSSSPYFALYINDTDDAPRFAVVASDGSALVPAGSALSVGWSHMVGVYDRTNDTAYLYVNGSLAASDSTWSGARKYYDVENTSGDCRLGTAGVAGDTRALQCPLGPISIYPFAMPADMVASMYNSAEDNRPVPGVYPLAVEGDMLGAGEEQLYCYAKVTNMRNAPYQLDGGAWEPGAMEVEFELFEATARAF